MPETPSDKDRQTNLEIALPESASGDCEFHSVVQAGYTVWIVAEVLTTYHFIRTYCAFRWLRGSFLAESHDLRITGGGVKNFQSSKSSSHFSRDFTIFKKWSSFFTSKSLSFVKT